MPSPASARAPRADSGIASRDSVSFTVFLLSVLRALAAATDEGAADSGAGVGLFILIIFLLNCIDL